MVNTHFRKRENYNFPVYGDLLRYTQLMELLRWGDLSQPFPKVLVECTGFQFSKFQVSIAVEHVVWEF